LNGRKKEKSEFTFDFQDFERVLVHYNDQQHRIETDTFSRDDEASNHPGIFRHIRYISQKPILSGYSTVNSYYCAVIDFFKEQQCMMANNMTKDSLRSKGVITLLNIKKGEREE
jgi:hypothetical protein